MKSFLLLVSCFFAVNIYAQSCSDGGTTRWEFNHAQTVTCKTIENADTKTTVCVTPKNNNNNVEAISMKIINDSLIAANNAVKNSQPVTQSPYYHYNKADDLDVSINGGFGAFK